MKQIVFYRMTGILSLWIVAVLFGGFDTLAATSIEEAVHNEITEMNQAITERDLDRLGATFAEGAIRLDLFPAHSYGKKKVQSNQVSDLANSWRSIAPILFATTRFYERVVTIKDIHIDKGMAMAWTTINTRSQSVKDGAEIKTNHFTEVYLLRFIDDSWKIAAVINNRQDNN